MSTALAARTEPTNATAVATVKQQMGLITDLMRGVMVQGEDYGVIPGTGSKPTLLKGGAEKLCVLFRLSTRVQKVMRELPGGHREYEITVTLHRRDEDGEFFGEGVGVASTMEAKYRWRNASRRCPACGKEAIIKGKAEYGGGWLCFKTKGGCGAKYADNAPEIVNQKAGRVENADVADCYNTVLKMAKKRALVDAVLTATAASQLFTQDLEDTEHADQGSEPAAAPAPAKEPTITPAQKQQLVGLAQQTADAKLSLKAMLAHFKVKTGDEIPATRYQEAVDMLRRMALPPAENPDADVPPEMAGAGVNDEAM